MCKSNRSAWFTWFMGGDMSEFSQEELPSTKDKIRLIALSLLPAAVLAAAIGLPLLIFL